MRLIDADELEIDEIDNVRCYSILQVDEAPTVQAVSIDVLDKIRAEIERQERWLMDTGYNACSVDIAFDAIKSVIAESEEICDT